jgi:DeoR family transcriptional regulator, suf operon transcriptional repressor
MTAAPSTKQDILDHLTKRGETTAQSLSESLGISPQAVRRHLKDMEDEGLIEHQVVQTGMGRPNHAYKLSKGGRDRLPDRYDEFALDLLDTLAESVGKDQVSNLLRQQWARKALEYRQRLGTGSLQERVAILVEIRKTEGYMAEWHSQAEAFVIAEYNCAIAQIAESFPSVCGNELEMFELALQDCKVERTHWLAEGEHRCGYLIQAK